MHTLNRLLTCLTLVAVLLPPATFALVSLDEKNAVQEELDHAIGSAVSTYQHRSGLQSMKVKNERIAQTQKKQIEQLNIRSRKLRQDLLKQKRIVKSVGERYGMVIASKEQVETLINTEKRRMTRYLKEQYLHGAAGRIGDTSVISAVLYSAQADHRADVVERTQADFLHDLVAAQKAFWRMEALEKERSETLNASAHSQQEFEQATEIVEKSAEELAEIQSIMEEVHMQVLTMQSELARIDTQLKKKAEQALIEKGLLDPDSAIATTETSVKPPFNWPVYGRISAGFMNSAYKKHFGVPHYGLDIVVGPETPVMSSADGVVFLYRDGGAKGYSYILIGHRGGYATLYGHMSASYVKAGDEVTAGQVIGLSGGQPGTHGTGPMYTGPHLHFEVILNGTNVDPATVLP